MPFQADAAQHCANCPHGYCVTDVAGRIRNRSTTHRIGQDAAIRCTFDSFVPGCDSDPQPDRDFRVYSDQLTANVKVAGAHRFPEGYNLNSNAIAKVHGDAFELVEAAALWNAAAAWNAFMDGALWPSTAFTCPEGAIPTALRKVGIVKLPRNYDTTLLFRDDVRNAIQAHDNALRSQGMELSLSSPDIVGVRLPALAPEESARFSAPLPNLGTNSHLFLQSAHRILEGKLDGSALLFAIAVKTSTRSDRLYQPLFEANVLKYYVSSVLRGSAFKFFVHMESFEGAAVEERYRAASLNSLLRGGAPTRAIDGVFQAVKPRAVAQEILNVLPSFPN